MRRVTVVVHAETQHPVDQLVGGWYDSSLTERGRKQARQLGTALRRVFPELHVPIVFPALSAPAKPPRSSGKCSSLQWFCVPYYRNGTTEAQKDNPRHDLLSGSWQHQLVDPGLTSGSVARSHKGILPPGCTRQWMKSSRQT